MEWPDCSKTLIERLDEERVEASHNPLHKIDEFLSKWNDRFTVDNPAFLDCYLKGDGHIVAIFHLIGGGSAMDLVAVFNALTGHWGVDMAPLENSGGGVCETLSGVVRRTSGGGHLQLLTLHPDWHIPSARILHKYFRREGLVKKPRRSRRRPHPGRPTAPFDAPNAIWSADFKGHFKTLDGRYCYASLSLRYNTRIRRAPSRVRAAFRNAELAVDRLQGLSHQLADFFRRLVGRLVKFPVENPEKRCVWHGKKRGK